MIIIDRFEGDFAVLETESGMLDVRRSLIPENAGEGDVLRSENGAYILDSEASEQRRATVREKLNRLRRRSND